MEKDKKTDPERFELTEEHFKLFKNEFNYWIDNLGLFTWEIGFLFEKNEKFRAQVSTNTNNMLATVSLSNEWIEISPDRELVARVAFHEVMEIFFDNILCFARMEAGSGMRNEIDQESHRIIRTLENVWWKPDWEARRAKGDV